MDFINSAVSLLGPAQTPVPGADSPLFWGQAPTPNPAEVEWANSVRAARAAEAAEEESIFAETAETAGGAVEAEVAETAVVTAETAGGAEVAGGLATAGAGSIAAAGLAGLGIGVGTGVGMAKATEKMKGGMGDAVANWLGYASEDGSARDNFDISSQLGRDAQKAVGPGWAGDLAGGAVGAAGGIVGGILGAGEYLTSGAGLAKDVGHWLGVGDEKVTYGE